MHGDSDRTNGRSGIWGNRWYAEHEVCIFVQRDKLPVATEVEIDLKIKK